MRGTRRDEELFRFLEGALRVTIRSWIFYSTTPQEREREEEEETNREEVKTMRFKSLCPLFL